VRIWNIEEYREVNMIRLDSSIISLSFHPQGQFIAIVSGAKLELWDWTHQTRGGNRPQVPAIQHTRNFRAVLFHPKGEILFAAAPEAPRNTGDSITYCCLYGIPLQSWLAYSALSSTSSTSTNNNSNSNSSATSLQDDLFFRLPSHMVILPQIHLYSDGGLDISPDGQYLATCARLYAPIGGVGVNSSHATTTRRRRRKQAMKYHMRKHFPSQEHFAMEEEGDSKIGEDMEYEGEENDYDDEEEDDDDDEEEEEEEFRLVGENPYYYNSHYSPLSTTDHMLEEDHSHQTHSLPNNNNNNSNQMQTISSYNYHSAQEQQQAETFSFFNIPAYFLDQSHCHLTTSNNNLSNYNDCTMMVSYL
jgi:hypothetical protein